MSSLAQVLTSPAGSYVIAIPAIFLVAIILIAIGLFVTRTDRPQVFRRHSGRDTYWSVQPEELERSEGVLTAEHQPKHSRAADDITYDTSVDDTVILDGTIETWESVGRRAVDSPVRHTQVPQDWRPPIGSLRIAILETATAEYLFVKQPKDQLRPRSVRPYMLTSAVQSW